MSVRNYLQHDPEDVMMTDKNRPAKNQQEDVLSDVINWVKKHALLAVLVMSGTGTALGFTVDAIARKVKDGYATN